MAEKKVKPEWLKDKEQGARTFQLTGYTTISKINRKFEAESRQRVLRKLLMHLIIAISVLVLLAIVNPFKSLVDFRRVVGIDSYYRSHVQEYATSETTTTLADQVEIVPAENQHTDQDSEHDNQNDQKNDTDDTNAEEDNSGN